MATQHPCILTLEPSVGIITNKQDLVAYTIRQFFGTPGRISDTYKTDIISFREIKSKYNNNIGAVAAQTEVALQRVIENLLPTEKVNVKCTLTPYKNDNRYTIEINVLARNAIGVDESILTTANVYVENGEFKIRLKGDKV